MYSNLIQPNSKFGGRANPLDLPPMQIAGKSSVNDLTRNPGGEWPLKPLESSMSITHISFDERLLTMSTPTPSNPTAGHVKRGPGFTPVEDLMCCKAFISASEDPIVGAGQKGKVFKKKVHDMYVSISDKQAEYDRKVMEQMSNGTRVSLSREGLGPGFYHPRTIESVYSRFKDKISPDVSKFLGVLDTTPKDSGENDEDHFEDCLAAYKERYGRQFDFVTCYHYLKDKAKYTIYLARGEQEDAKKNERPKGSKAAKKAVKDAAFIKEAMNAAKASCGATASGSSADSPNDGLSSQVGAIMGLAGDALKSFIDAQEQANLMQLLDTPDKKAMAKEAAKLRIAELSAKRRKLEASFVPDTIGPNSSVSSIDSPVEKTT